MSSSIYQELQSCLQPRLMEQPRVLTLKLTPSKSSAAAAEEDSDLSSTYSDPLIQTHLEMGENDVSGAGDSPADDGAAENGAGNDVGGWSFLQARSGRVYVHPPAKQYSSPAMALSEKSLEMCTESLGSETGSDDSEIGGDERMSLFSSDETEISPPSATSKKSSRFSRLRAKRLGKPSYPPPLTSMSGPMNIKMKPYREGGRLVMKAVSIPSPKPCFEVERGGGRLRLRLLKHCLMSNNNLEEVEEEVEEILGEREEESNESGSGGGRRRKGRRCKEGGGGGRKELLNWEPFLVST